MFEEEHKQTLLGSDKYISKLVYIQEVIKVLNIKKNWPLFYLHL